MGNCLTSNNKVLAEENDPIEHEPKSSQVESMEETGEFAASCCSQSEEPKNKVELETKVKKKKMVRFKLNEENQGESRNGVVRIRLVVTQKELKQILSCRKDLKQQNSSMEQLIKVMKLRGIRVSNDHDDGFHGGWRPELESIPEEH